MDFRTLHPWRALSCSARRPRSPGGIVKGAVDAGGVARGGGRAMISTTSSPCSIVNGVFPVAAESSD